MKSRILTLAALLVMQASSLFAAFPDKGHEGFHRANTQLDVDASKLAPSSIFPATFEDGTDAVAVAAPCVSKLVPVTPSVADFEEFSMEQVISEMLRPATPRVADFEDVTAESPSAAFLAPVTPTTAEFEDYVSEPADFRPIAPVTPDLADFEEL